MNDLYQTLIGGRTPMPYFGQGGGESAHRDLHGFFPEDRQDGALWPLKYRWQNRLVMFLQEKWARWRGRAVEADDLHAERLLWRRHPWMLTGNLWWRPWWPEPDMVATGLYETIDPESGLHRWKVDHIPDDGVHCFDVEKYYVALLRRNVR